MFMQERLWFLDIRTGQSAHIMMGVRLFRAAR